MWQAWAHNGAWPDVMLRMFRCYDGVPRCLHRTGEKKGPQTHPRARSHGEHTQMWGPSLDARWHLATLSKRKSDFRQPPSGRRIVVYEMPFNDDRAGPFPIAAFNITMLLWGRGAAVFATRSVGAGRG